MKAGACLQLLRFGFDFAAAVSSAVVGLDSQAVALMASADTSNATCQNDSTTMVAVGDSGIGDPTSSRNSPVYCATNCGSREWGGNFRKEFCRADTGTVTIYCRALIGATSAP